MELPGFFHLERSARGMVRITRQLGGAMVNGLIGRRITGETLVQERLREKINQTQMDTEIANTLGDAELVREARCSMATHELRLLFTLTDEGIRHGHILLYGSIRAILPEGETFVGLTEEEQVKADNLELFHKLYHLSEENS